MQKNKNEKSLIFTIIVIAAISVAAFLGVAALLLTDMFFDGNNMVEIEIPKYRGEHESDIALTERIELEKSYIFSDSFERGIVISQSKEGRVKVPRGEKYYVKISVSLGGKTHILPNLVGLDIYEASGILREMGCVVKTQFSESEKAQDSVLFTIPRAGAQMKEGDEVIIYVASRGAPSTVTVPDFYGCSLDGLTSRVEDSGLNLGKIDYIYSEDFLPDSVVYQSLGRGCIVKMGETVDFYISRLPKA